MRKDWEKMWVEGSGFVATGCSKGGVVHAHFGAVTLAARCGQSEIPIHSDVQ